MASKNRLGLNFDGLEQLAKKFRELAGDTDELTVKILEKSRDDLTEKLIADTVKSNFPAKGKFSTGRTAKSITKNSVEKVGMGFSVEVGYDLKKSGMTSIYLMYGTPKMKKVQKIYNDFYGTKVVKERQDVQRQMFLDAIEEKMGG